MITEQQIHYLKCSIRNFKEAPRIKVNMSLVNKEGKMNNFTWRLTQERREVYNALEGAEDEGWTHYDEYVDAWKEIRKEYGQSRKLWIGKLAQRAKWSKGAQPLNRVTFAVGLLQLDRQSEDLRFTFNLQGWQKQFELQTIEGAQYNRVYTWQNPMTSVEGPRTVRSLF